MCVDVNVLAKKYSVPIKKLFIIASMSGAYIEGDKICGEVDEALIAKYKEIENKINNDEIVELEDERLADLFREYNIVKAYNTLFVTRRIPVSANILAKFPCIRRTAIILSNVYYITPAQYLKLKILMQKEKERVETIVIDIDDEDEANYNHHSSKRGGSKKKEIEQTTPPTLQSVEKIGKNV